MNNTMKKPIIKTVLPGLLIFALSASAIAQNYAKQLQFFSDYTQFRATGDYSYVELYFAIPRDLLGHKPDDMRYTAKFQLSVQLFEGDSLLTTKSWMNQDNVPSLENITAGQMYTTQTAFFLKEGEYRVQTYLETQTELQESENSMRLRVRAIPADTLAVSGIQLGLDIQKDQEKGQFTKNGYKVIPNVQGIFGSALPEIHYYAEIYNLSGLKADTDSSYTIQITVKNDTYTVVKRPPKIERTRAGEALVETGIIDVSDLRSGAYLLSLSVTDEGTGARMVSEKGFYVYRPAEVAQRSTEDEPIDRVVPDEFTFMSEEELDYQFDTCRYIATKQENKVWKDLDLDGKRSFMSEFWKNRDPDPFTPESEYKVEYARRVVRANARFSMGKKMGWRSDRGRVLILYGDPDEIDTHPITPNSRGYEIWYYRDARGNNQFVFVDLSRMGDMRLIHSTVPSETKNYDWRSLVR